MNHQIRICMVGAGRVGKNHTNAFTRHIPAGFPVALVDPAPEVLKATGDEYGIDSRFATLEEALEKIPFDAVVITTPTFTHRDLAVMAAEKRKHVFVEKPLAMNLLECDEMITACQKNGVILQIGFNRRFDPEFVAAAKMIENGDIGKPMMIKSLSHGPGLPPRWACDLTTSGGMLAEVNSHDLDVCRWLMGSDFERVYMEVANFKGEANKMDMPNFYDNMLFNIKFESQGLGTISGICPCKYGYDARAEIVGELGILQIGSLEKQDVIICTNRDQGMVRPIYRTWGERFLWAFIYELEGFVKAIQTGTPARVGGEEGRYALAAVLAGNKSMFENRPVYMREVLI